MTSEIQIHNAGKRDETKSFTFPVGELMVQISNLPYLVDGFTVHDRLLTADSLIRLLLACEILSRLRCSGRKTLVFLYFSDAHQDRVMHPHEAFSLKAAARLVNCLGFDEGLTFNAHRDMTAARVENIRIIPPETPEPTGR
ncbi:MAG: hypothetical protein K8U57_20910 [Planctomycetes bacterium]|nr:hypothetical protein [Planctomycetota bacterium]